MATRRDAREWVVQLLFQLDMNPDAKLDGVFQRFWKDVRPESDCRDFAERIVRGVRDHGAKLDEVICKYAEHWDLHRMAVVDRNVMRMAVFEMLFCDDIPPVVSINEAVDLAKYFSSTESGKFVNGILDRVRKDLNRPARSARPDGQQPSGAEA